MLMKPCTVPAMRLSFIRIAQNRERHANRMSARQRSTAHVWRVRNYPLKKYYSPWETEGTGPLRKRRESSEAVLSRTATTCFWIILAAGIPLEALKVSKVNKILREA